MFRIDGPGATNDNKFTEGDPANGTRATVVTDDWLNSVQEEVAEAIESDGLELDKSDSGQLSKTIQGRLRHAGSVGELESLPLSGGTIIYLAEKGRAGDFVVKTGTPPSDPHKGIYIVLSNGNYAERVDKSILTPEMFGATDSDTDDNGDALTASATAAAAGTWALTRSKYATSKEVQVPPGTRVVCLSGECEIDGSSIQSADAPNSSILYFGGGGETQLPALASDLQAGDVEVNFSSAHGLSEGKRFFIFNPTESSFSDFRTSYYAGEWCQVVTVDSTTKVTVSAPLYDNYAVADVDLYAPDMSVYSFIGKLKAFTSGNNFANRGINLKRVSDTDVSGLSSRCKDSSSALVLTQCVGVTGGGITAHQSGAGGLGTDYGISISNCQDCTLEGDFSARRHGVTHGGANEIGSTPCRNIKVYGTAKTTGKITSVLALDWHGNSEHCYFEGIALGGVNPGGNNNTFRGKVFDNEEGALVYCTEWLGHNFDFSGTRFISRNSNANLGGRGGFDIGGGQDTIDARTRFGGTLDLSNTKWNVPATDSVAVFNWRNRGAAPAEPMKINLSGASFENTNPAITNMIRVSVVSGDKAQSVVLSGMESDASRPMLVDGAERVIGPNESGVETLTTSTLSADVSVSVTFSRRFPRPPAVTLGPNHRLDGANYLAAAAENVTETGFTLFLYTANGSNFNSDLDRDVSWSAESVTNA